jgi:hypothetical protein
MAVVMVEIRPKSPDTAGAIPAGGPLARPIGPTVDEPEGAELVEDMDQYVEHVMCACSAGDDNPY